MVGGEVDDEGVIRKICVVPKPYQQPHQPMFQPFSVSEATIRYTAQSDIVPVILTAYPPRLRPFRGSLPTLRWREVDSNFRFRVRCKRGLRRKSPASAACRRRLSGAAGSARDKGFALRLRAEGHRRQTFSVMASTRLWKVWLF